MGFGCSHGCVCVASLDASGGSGGPLLQDLFGLGSAQAQLEAADFSSGLVLHALQYFPQGVLLTG